MIDNARQIRKIPSTVHLENSATETPKASDGKKKLRNMRRIEVDAYEDPTELFQWMNYGNYKGAAARALEYPREAKTWIVSRRKHKSEQDGQVIKWKYLPIHMVCMKTHPPKDLFDALVSSYPEGIRERDYDGNLPIHYLLSEGCEKGEFVKALLQAYPKSIEEKNNEGKTPLEIVSYGYRKGSLEKDSMVNILAILRQWKIGGEGQHILVRQQTAKSRLETIDNCNPTSSNVGLKTSSTEQNQWKSSSAKSGRGIIKVDSYDVELRDGIEMKLETTLTERDILRKTVSNLKNETKNQDLVLVALNNKVENTTHDQSKLKDKLKKKREKVGELQAALKETMKDQEDKISKHKQIFHDKELSIAKKDQQINDMCSRIEFLTEENDKLRRSNSYHSEDMDKVKSALENSREENSKLKLRVDELMQSRNEAENEAELNGASLRQRINELETKLGNMHTEIKESRVIKKDASVMQADIKSRENRLLTRISTLEKELMEALGKDYEDRLSQVAASSGLEDERDALKEMNTSLQEHVGALKERCKKLESIEESKEGLQISVQRLESDLVTARLKQTKYQEEIEQCRSDSLIRESRLQTQVAKLERDLLEELGSKELASAGTNPEEEKLAEELQASQMMTSSLQGHVAVLKEKCSILESTLGEAKEKNDSLRKEIRAMKADTLNAREREINSDYQNLISMIQDISTTGKNTVGSEDLSNIQDENDSLRDENESLHKACGNMKSKLVEAQAKFINLERNQLAKLESEKAKLEDKNEELATEQDIITITHNKQLMKVETERTKLEDKYTRMSREQDAQKTLLGERLLKLELGKKELEEKNKELWKHQSEVGNLLKELKVNSLNEIKDLDVQLRDVEKKSKKYKDQLIHLKERHEKMKTKNAELRDIISKNNETYLAKVDSLSKEVEDVRSVNNSLRGHIQDLSTENEILRKNGYITDTVTTAQQKKKIDEMKVRLNQIAGYLIAVALSVEDQKNNFNQQQNKKDEEKVDVYDNKTSKNKMQRDSIHEEMVRRQKIILATDERDDIIGIAARLGRDIQSPYNFSQQREGLNEISISLQNLVNQ